MLKELTLHGKKYTQKEIDRKLLLVMPGHCWNRVLSIREHVDFNNMSLEKLFGKLEAYIQDGNKKG